MFWERVDPRVGACVSYPSSVSGAYLLPVQSSVSGACVAARAVAEVRALLSLGLAAVTAALSPPLIRERAKILCGGCATFASDLRAGTKYCAEGEHGRSQRPGSWARPLTPQPRIPTQDAGPRAPPYPTVGGTRCPLASSCISAVLCQIPRYASTLNELKTAQPMALAH